MIRIDRSCCVTVVRKGVTVVNTARYASVPVPCGFRAVGGAGSGSHIIWFGREAQLRSRRDAALVRRSHQITSYSSCSASDPAPLPKIQDTLDKVGKVKFFASLDCLKAFWQIPNSKTTQPRTAINFPKQV